VQSIPHPPFELLHLLLVEPLGHVHHLEPADDVRLDQVRGCAGARTNPLHRLLDREAGAIAPDDPSFASLHGGPLQCIEDLEKDLLGLAEAREARLSLVFHCPLLLRRGG